MSGLSKSFLIMAVCVCLLPSCGMLDGDADTVFGTALEESIETQESAEQTQDEICVYVCGAVKNPGVYILHNGERKISAIEAAGGFDEDACTDVLNLASPAVDGERIYVPVADEVGDADLQQGLIESSKQTRININTADKETLMSLPGIGESKAQKIIDYRESNGRFSDTEELKNVPGIKEGTFDALKDLIEAG